MIKEYYKWTFSAFCAFGGRYFRNIYSKKEINRWKKIVNRFVGILKKIN